MMGRLLLALPLFAALVSVAAVAQTPPGLGIFPEPGAVQYQRTAFADDATRHGFASDQLGMLVSAAVGQAWVAGFPLSASGTDTLVPSWNRTDLFCHELLRLTGSGSAALCINRTSSDVGESTTRLMRLDVATGSTVWTSDAFRGTMYPTTPLYAAGANPDTADAMGVVGWTATNLYRFDLSTGVATWTWSLANFCIMCYLPPSAVFFDAATNTIASGPVPSLGILLHDATTGDLKFTSTLNNTATAPSAYVSFAEPRWVFTNQTQLGPLAAAPNGWIYVASSPTGLDTPRYGTYEHVSVFAISATTGIVAREVAIPPSVASASGIFNLLAPVDKSGTLSLWLSYDVAYTAVRLSSDVKLLSPQAIASCAPIALAWGSVYCGQNNVRVYDPTTGTKRVEFTADAGVPLSVRNGFRVIPMTAGDAASIAATGQGSVLVISGGSVSGLHRFTMQVQTDFQIPFLWSIIVPTNSYGSTPVVTGIGAAMSPLLAGSMAAPNTINAANVSEVVFANARGGARRIGLLPDARSAEAVTTMAQPVDPDHAYTAFLSGGQSWVSAHHLSTGIQVWSMRSPVSLNSGMPFISVGAAVMSLQPNGVWAFAKADGFALTVPMDNLCGATAFNQGNGVVYATDPQSPNSVWFTTGSACLYRYTYPQTTIDAFPLNATTGDVAFLNVTNNSRVIIDYGNCAYTILELLPTPERTPVPYSAITVPQSLFPPSGQLQMCVATAINDRLVVLQSWQYGWNSPSAQGAAPPIVVTYAIGDLAPGMSPERRANVTTTPLYYETLPVGTNTNNGYNQFYQPLAYNNTLLVQSSLSVFWLAVGDAAPAGGRLLWVHNYSIGASEVQAATFDLGTGCNYVADGTNVTMTCFSGVDGVGTPRAQVMWQVPNAAGYGVLRIAATSSTSNQKNARLVATTSSQSPSVALYDGFTGKQLLRVNQLSGMADTNFGDRFTITTASSPTVVIPWDGPSGLPARGVIFWPLGDLSGRIASTSAIPAMVPNDAPLAPGFTLQPTPPTPAPYNPNGGSTTPTPHETPPAPNGIYTIYMYGSQPSQSFVFNTSWYGATVPILVTYNPQAYSSANYWSVYNAANSQQLNNNPLSPILADAFASCSVIAGGKVALFCAMYDGLVAIRTDVEPTVNNTPSWKAPAVWATGGARPIRIVYDGPSQLVCVISSDEAPTACYDELTGALAFPPSSAIPGSVKGPLDGSMVTMIVASTLVASSGQGGVFAMPITGPAAGNLTYADGNYTADPAGYVFSDPAAGAPRWCYTMNLSPVYSVKCITIDPATSAVTVAAFADIAAPVAAITVVAPGYVALNLTARITIRNIDAPAAKGVGYSAPHGAVPVSGMVGVRCNATHYGFMVAFTTAEISCVWPTTGALAWTVRVAQTSQGLNGNYPLLLAPKLGTGDNVVAVFGAVLDTALGVAVLQFSQAPVVDNVFVIAATPDPLILLGTEQVYNGAPSWQPNQFTAIDVKSAVQAYSRRYGTDQAMKLPSGDAPAEAGIIVTTGIAGIVAIFSAATGEVVRSAYPFTNPAMLDGTLFNPGNTQFFQQSAIVNKGLDVVMVSGATLAVADIATLTTKYTVQLTDQCEGAAPASTGPGRYAATYRDPRDGDHTVLAFWSGTCAFRYSSAEPNTIRSVNIGQPVSLTVVPEYAADANALCIATVYGEVACFDGETLVHKFTKQIEFGRQISQLTSSGTMLVAAVSSNNDQSGNVIACVDIMTTKVAWTIAVPLNGYISSMKANGVTLIVGSDNGVQAYDTSAGVGAAPTLAWARNTASGIVFDLNWMPTRDLLVAITSDSYYYPDQGLTVAAVDPRTGNASWVTKPADACYASKVIVPWNEVLVDCATGVYRLNLTDGSTIQPMIFAEAQNDLSMGFVDDAVVAVSTSNYPAQSYVSVKKIKPAPGAIGPTLPAQTTVAAPTNTLPPAATNAPLPPPATIQGGLPTIKAYASPMRQLYVRDAQGPKRCTHPTLGPMVVGWDNLAFLVFDATTGKNTFRLSNVAPWQSDRPFDVIVDATCAAAWLVFVDRVGGDLLPWIAVDPATGAINNVSAFAARIPGADSGVVDFSAQAGIHSNAASSLLWPDLTTATVIHGIDSLPGGTAGVWAIETASANFTGINTYWRIPGTTRLAMVCNSSATMIAIDPTQPVGQETRWTYTFGRANVATNPVVYTRQVGDQFVVFARGNEFQVVATSGPTQATVAPGGIMTFVSTDNNGGGNNLAWQNVFAWALGNDTAFIVVGAAAPNGYLTNADLTASKYGCSFNGSNMVPVWKHSHGLDSMRSWIVAGRWLIAVKTKHFKTYDIYTGNTIDLAAGQSYNGARLVAVLQATADAPLTPPTMRPGDTPYALFGMIYSDAINVPHLNVYNLSNPSYGDTVPLIAEALIAASPPPTSFQFRADVSTLADLDNAKGITVSVLNKAQISAFSLAKGYEWNQGFFSADNWQLQYGNGETTGIVVDGTDNVLVGVAGGIVATAPDLSTAWSAPNGGSQPLNLAVAGDFVLSVGPINLPGAISQLGIYSPAVELYTLTRDVVSGEVTGAAFQGLTNYAALCPVPNQWATIQTSHAPVVDPYAFNYPAFFFTANTRCLYRASVQADSSVNVTAMPITASPGDQHSAAPLVMREEVIYFNAKQLHVIALDRVTMERRWLVPINWATSTTAAVAVGRYDEASNEEAFALTTTTTLYCFTSRRGLHSHSSAPVETQTANTFRGIQARVKLGVFVVAYDNYVAAFRTADCLNLRSPLWIANFSSDVRFPAQGDALNATDLVAADTAGANGGRTVTMINATNGKILWSAEVKDSQVKLVTLTAGFVMFGGDRGVEARALATGTLAAAYPQAAYATAQWYVGTPNGFVQAVSTDYQAPANIQDTAGMIRYNPATIVPPLPTIVPTTTPGPTTTTTGAPATTTTTSSGAPMTTTTTTTTAGPAAPTTTTASAGPSPPPTPTGSTPPATTGTPTSTSGPSDAPGPTTTAPATTNAPHPTSGAAPDDKGGKMSTGEVVGIIIAAVVVVGVIAAAILLTSRARSRKQQQPSNIDYAQLNDPSAVPGDSGRLHSANEMRTPRDADAAEVGAETSV